MKRAEGPPEGPPQRDTAQYHQRVLMDTLVPAFTGLLLGGAVGAVLAAVQVPEASVGILIGGGAAIGAVGGVLIGASRGMRLRAPDEADQRR